MARFLRGGGRTGLGSLGPFLRGVFLLCVEVLHVRTTGPDFGSKRSTLAYELLLLQVLFVLEVVEVLKGHLGLARGAHDVVLRALREDNRILHLLDVLLAFELLEILK